MELSTDTSQIAIDNGLNVSVGGSLLQDYHFLPLTQFTLAISSSMFEIQLMCFLGI